MNIVWLVNYFTDCAFILFYFRKSTNTPGKTRRFLKPILLLLLLPLYLNTVLFSIPYSLIRVAIRFIVFFLFLRYAECASARIAIYASLFWTTVYVLFQNVTFGPYLNSFFSGEAQILSSPFWNQFILSSASAATRLVYLGVIAALFRFPHMTEAKTLHTVLAAGVCLLSTYTQHTGMEFRPIFTRLPSRATAYSFTTFYILLHVVLLLFLLAFEYSRRQSSEYAAMVKQNTESQALLENIRSQQQSEESIRSLRHDLKNHAIALRILLEQEDTEKALKYLDTIQNEAAVPTGTFHTGSDLLNGLLHQKLSPALEQGINVEVTLDFRQGEFIEPFDICVLMGNVLDNAVEACLKMTPSDRRYIKVSGSPSANCLLIRVENSCETDSVASSDFPHTTKKNTVLHGYGLRNIQRTLNRYNGNLTIGAEESDRFTLTMLIPIP